MGAWDLMLVTDVIWLRSMLLCPIFGMLLAIYKFKNKYEHKRNTYGYTWNDVDGDDWFQWFCLPWLFYTIMLCIVITTFELAIVGAGY